MTEEARRRALERARIEEEAACVVARLADADDPHRQEAAHRWAGQSPAHAIAVARAETPWGALEAIAGPAGRLEALFTRRRIAAASAPAALMIVAVEKLTPVDRVSTETGQQRTVVLVGVSVLLGTATTIEMATRAGKRAAPVPEGEAAFDVAPYVRRPFGVSAKGAVVRALGTGFNLHIRRHLVEPTATRGRVSARDGDSAVRSVAAGHGAAARDGSVALFAPGGHQQG